MHDQSGPDSTQNPPFSRRPDATALRPQLQHLQAGWPTGPDAARLTFGGGDDVFFDRWTSVNDEPFELRLESCVEEHVFSLPLRRSLVVYNIGKKIITDNETFPGQPFLNGPVSSVSRKVYVGGFDVFRLSLSNVLLQERLQFGSGRAPDAQVHLFGPHVSSDLMVRELLIAGEQAASASDDLCLASIGLALAEYAAIRFTRGAATRRVPPLSKTRLRRVVDYIEAHLAHRITLAELSALAGLSRPHFAAQFKAATGRTPYAYVTHRRLHLAQSLLGQPDLPIKDVAQMAGFNTQAHFTLAFRRSFGETPLRWRRSIAPTPAAPSALSIADHD